MLGPSALFNTGYRHGANGDGKEPRSVGYSRLPVLCWTSCFLRRKPEGRLLVASTYGRLASRLAIV
eukprot:scaffold3027_cov62-Attheya_sp.AAC.1